ncbi:uncharacterized threonine-rich GPI-anchored glycoprotein PJ4664.02-like [Rhopalosiphum maidis]|uniref:uncharacterized threonine-rich GPI-anchored glycoprotein PJ4664.02-like n=1 Tax=Rhopalosiphum maidis TaxID=43146 RepID=UPI000EFEDE5B|nr:uncharacterized threonine-rich GPI-anchored glycoprotein PJ4664.02-like [Rhopalosiphum maidis]
MMSGLTFFLAVVVSLQVAQDGVHSCTLRNHKDKVACSILGATDPTLANSRHTSAPCVTPKLGLQHPSVLNKIPRPGSDLINPAVPSDSLLPSLSPTPAAHITVPPPINVTVPNAKIEVTAAAVIESATVTVPVDVPKSTSSTETTPAISEPSSIFPATDTNSIPTNAAVQSTDSVSVDVAAVASVDSSTVAPEASGSVLEPAASPVPVSDTVPVADSVSTSTSAAESLAPLSQFPSNTTTPSIIV